MKNVEAFKKETNIKEHLNPTLKEYKDYRLAGINLMTKLADFVFNLRKNERVMQAGKLLNIVNKDILLLHSESERDFLLDFLIFDYNFDSLKSNIETYISLNSAQNDIEQKLFKAILKSYTSLFRIVSIDKSDCKLYLYDILNAVSEIPYSRYKYEQIVTTWNDIFHKINTIGKFQHDFWNVIWFYK